MRVSHIVAILLVTVATSVFGDNPSTTTTVSVSVEVLPPPPNHGHVPIASPSVPRQGGAGIGLLPGAFLAGEIDDVDLLGVSGGLLLPSDRLWLRCGDAVYPLPTGPLLGTSGPTEVEFRPGWLDAPGTYKGRLVASTARGERTVDLEAEVPAFVAHEVIADQLVLDVNGNAVMQAEFSVTSNARTWRLMFALETIMGDAAGVKVVAARDNAVWRVSNGVVVGRGPVDAETVTISAHGRATANAWRGVVVITDVSGR